VRFAAAHFATYRGGCEPLHGHSYEVAVEASGSLDAGDAWVFDFTELKAIVRSVCGELDHKFMLQRESRLLAIAAGDSNWKVRTPGGIGYVLPVSDVVALPLDNTTAERLAEYLSARVRARLVERGAANLSSLVVEVWEGPGQSARHESRLPEE
jgi:6-pyruvoyltetrahydropterin/6-carboxytetrahydropterin synthase